MAKIKFRFTTECEVLLEGASYEEAYMKFKDFMHGEANINQHGGLNICPPETPEIFFEVDDQTDYNRIGVFKGDFVQDIVNNCSSEMQEKIHHVGFA